MKAAVLTGIEKIEVQDVQAPELSSDSEVLLRVSLVGICRSDIHYYLRGRIGDQVVSYPFIPGHECAAVVEKAGNLVRRIKEGDRVAIDPAISCGACDQCLEGRFHTCRSLHFLGCPGQASGCLAESIVIPGDNCYRMGEEMSLIQGALIEPLAIGIYAVDLAKSGKAQRVGILGCGPLGLSVLVSSKEAGIPFIAVTDKIPERLAAALANGADSAGNPLESDIVAGILNAGGELDAVFECSGDQQALGQAVELLRPGGKLLILGIPEEDRVSFNISKLRRKEILIQNVRRQNRCTARAMEMVASGRITPDIMATHFFSLEEAGKAFEVVANYRDGVIKALISF